MQVSAPTLLILQINRAIDSGKYNAISIADIHDAIERRSLLQFLKTSCKDEMDLSIHFSDAFGDFEGFYEETIGRIFDGYAGDGRRQ